MVPLCRLAFAWRMQRNGGGQNCDSKPGEKPATRIAGDSGPQYVSEAVGVHGGDSRRASTAVQNDARAAEGLNLLLAHAMRGLHIIDFCDCLAVDRDMQLAAADSLDGVHRYVQVVVLAFLPDQDVVGVDFAHVAKHTKLKLWSVPAPRRRGDA